MAPKKEQMKEAVTVSAEVDPMSYLFTQVREAVAKQAKAQETEKDADGISRNLEVQRSGQMIIIPENVSLREAIKLLERREKYEEEVVDFKEKIDCFIWDGVIAFQKAMQRMFGWASAEPKIIESFFGREKIPPEMIAIETGYNQTTMGMWGEFTVPGISGKLRTGFSVKQGRVIFELNAQIKRKDEKKVKALAELTKIIVKEESIYRGKALKIRFYTDDEGRNRSKLELPEPTFMNLTQVKEDEIMFSDNVDAAIKTSIFTVIERSAHCRQIGIPLKRGVLLSGPYGTGKTLAAYVTAAKCERNRWTFLYCERADELDEMVKFAHAYQPAVVFCEDIDRVVSGERSVEMDDILNIIDGIESKKTEIMVILTTNFVEKINKAMLRPGRLDAVINVLPPDAQTVERLLRLYGRGLIPENENLVEIGKILAGQIPAVIRECVERAKLSAIRLIGPNDVFVVPEKTLIEAALGMKVQLDLLKNRGDNRTEPQRAAALTAKLFEAQLKNHDIVSVEETNHD